MSNDGVYAASGMLDLYLTEQRPVMGAPSTAERTAKRVMSGVGVPAGIDAIGSSGEIVRQIEVDRLRPLRPGRLYAEGGIVQRDLLAEFADHVDEADVVVVTGGIESPPQTHRQPISRLGVIRHTAAHQTQPPVEKHRL